MARSDGRRSRRRGAAAVASGRFRSFWACAVLFLSTSALLGCRGILGIHELDDFDAGEQNGTTPTDDASGTGPGDTSRGDGRVDATDATKDASLVGDAPPGAADGTPADSPAASAEITAVATLDFGTVTVGQPDPSGQIQVTNTGTEPTNPLSVRIAGSGVSIASDTCAGLTLAPALSCIITVTLDTSTSKPITGSVNVNDTATDHTAITVTGNVVAPGSVSIAPTSDAFPAVAVGSTGSPVGFTLSNTGAQSTGVLSVIVGGTNHSEFTLADGCSGKTLGPAETCSVMVTFAPTSAGPKIASLEASSTPGGAGTASLTGSALAPALLSVSPTAANFRPAPTFGTGTLPTAIFAVSNSGNAASGVITTGIKAGAGTASTEFTIVADTCNGQTLAAMATCQLTVQFKPASAGAKSASLQVSGAAAVPLTGVGEDEILLTVTKTGAGSGTVTDDKGLISCGGTCSGEELRTTSNPVVTLTATPDAQSVFAGWTGGGCSGTTNPCLVTLSAATTVSARFDPAPVALTVLFHGLGTQSASIKSTPSGITCSGASCTAKASFDVGTTVVLSVTQASGAIVAWSNGCTSTSCSVPMTAAATVSVTTTNQNIVFITSTTHNGDFGGLAGANSFCASAASAAGVPGTFVAMLGTSTASMFAPLGSARGWIRPDGLPFTDTVSGLQNNSVMWYPAVLDPSGAPDVGDYFTGWQGAQSCSDWTSSTGNGTSGSGSEGAYWTGVDGYDCSSAAHLACFGTDFMTPVSVTRVAGRHVFASSAPFTPSAGLAAADALCRTEAAAAGLANPTHFLAALATTTASVASRFNLSGATWVRVDGVPVADTVTDFMQGNLIAPPATDENGKSAPNPAWFGAGAMTTPAASASDDCNNWSSVTSTARILEPIWGGPNAPSAFSEFSGTSACNSTGYEILCMEN